MDGLGLIITLLHNKGDLTDLLHKKILHTVDDIEHCNLYGMLISSYVIFVLFNIPKVTKE